MERTFIMVKPNSVACGLVGEVVPASSGAASCCAA